MSTPKSDWCALLETQERRKKEEERWKKKTADVSLIAGGFARCGVGGCSTSVMLRRLSDHESPTLRSLREAAELWTQLYTEMGWCDNMRDKLGSYMLLHATCSWSEIEPRFILAWLQGPVLQDEAAANRRRCVRNVLTVAAQREDENGIQMSVLYARAMLAYHYTLAAIGRHMHNKEDGEVSTSSDVDEADDILNVADNLHAQLQPVKQMWYDAGFKGNFADKNLRDEFVDQSTKDMQLEVMSLHTLQNYLPNMTAGARFSEMAASTSSGMSAIERQQRHNKKAGASSSAGVVELD